MLNFFIDSIVLFLLLYALVCISVQITEFVTRKTDSKISYAIIKPTENEKLEYSIRCAASYAARAGFPLIVLDNNLSENSRYIINALAEEFQNILFVTPKEFAEKYL